MRLSTHHLSVALAILLGGALTAQSTEAQPRTIAGGEYFFNVDPGQGNGTPLSGGDDYVSTELSLATTSLPIGDHVIYVRYRSSEGSWGPAVGTPFVIRADEGDGVITLAGGEYFVGADPGAGNGSAFAASGTTFMVGLSATLSALDPGTHHVSIRFRDSRGVWGPAVSAPLVVRSPAEANITAAEYFVRTSGPPGSGVTIPPVGPAADERVFQVAGINIDSLGVGNHRIYARVMREDGTWSRVVSTTVAVSEESLITAVSDTAYTIIGRSVSIPVLRNDVYAGSGVLRVQSIHAPSHGAATIVADTLVAYSPNQDYFGWDQFVYEASSGDGLSAEGIVLVNVRNVTEAICSDDATRPYWDGMFFDHGDGTGHVEVSAAAGFLSVALTESAQNTTLLAPRSAAGDDLDDLHAGGTALPPRNAESGVGRSVWTYSGFAPSADVRIMASATTAGHGTLSAVVSDQCDRSIEVRTAVALDGEEELVPIETTLLPIFPNPTSSISSVRFHLRHPVHVVIKIFDVTGRDVATLVDEYLPAGVHERTWSAAGSARALGSGVYFYRMNAGIYQGTQSVVLLRTD